MQQVASVMESWNSQTVLFTHQKMEIVCHIHRLNAGHASPMYSHIHGNNNENFTEKKAEGMRDGREGETEGASGHRERETYGTCWHASPLLLAEQLTKQTKREREREKKKNNNNNKNTNILSVSSQNEHHPP